MIALVSFLSGFLLGAIVCHQRNVMRVRKFHMREFSRGDNAAVGRGKRCEEYMNPWTE
jgi:hypothetical protein